MRALIRADISDELGAIMMPKWFLMSYRVRAHNSTRNKHGVSQLFLSDAHITSHNEIDFQFIFFVGARCSKRFTRPKTRMMNKFRFSNKLTRESLTMWWLVHLVCGACVSAGLIFTRSTKVLIKSRSIPMRFGFVRANASSSSWCGCCWCRRAPCLFSINIWHGAHTHTHAAEAIQFNRQHIVLCAFGFAVARV